ncbi:MAG: WD40 repeat domain-containing protein [Planctomycetes bacterium]|nr:WD40 repeat domain-containing protein [Planctomycetota bacterium]
MRKFVRRYKFQFAAATIVLLTLIAGIIGTTWFALEAQTRATEAEHARDVAHAEATRADRERDIAEWNGYFGLLQAAAVAAENREYDRARRLLARCPEEHRGFEWRHRSQSLETALFTLEGHEGDVRRISFSPDGHKLVSSSYDHTARIWDLRTGALLSTLRGHTWDVSDARFSPDGRRIATSSGDKTVRIWDASSGECLHVLEGHEDYLASVMYSPDGTLLLSFSQQEKTFRTWDAGTGTAVRVFEGHEENLFSVEFSEDGSQVISAGLDKTIRIWDVATGELLRTLVDPEFAIHSARSFAHGTRILSVPFRGSTVRVWDATSGELLHSLECHGLAHPRPILYADETRVFISAWGAESFAWDISGPTALRLEGLPGGIHEASISRDGRHALSEGRIWEPGTGVILRTLPTKGPGIFSPDGSIIATRSGSKIRIWDTRTDGLRHALPYHRGDVVAAQFSRASDRIVTMDWGPGENVVRVWDTATGALRTTLRHVSRDGSEQGTEDFDPVPRTLTQVFGRDRFKQVTLSPNGSLLALATAQGALVVWQVITEHRLWARPPETGVRCARFDSDGERLLTGHADGTVRVWQAKDGELSRTFGGHTGSINSVAWSSDDLRIVTTSEDATVRIWDPTTGTCLHVLEGHRTVTSTRLSDDGRLLVSSSGDGGVGHGGSPQSGSWTRTVVLSSTRCKRRGPRVDRTSLSPTVGSSSRAAA